MKLKPLYYVWIYTYNAAGNLEIQYFATRSCEGPGAAGQVFYEGRLQHSGVFRRDLFGTRRSYGRSDMSSGSLVLEGRGGAKDALKDLNFDGALVVLFEALNGIAPNAPNQVGGDPVIWRRLAGQPEFDQLRITVPIRDQAYSLLNKPLLGPKYGGTNVLPNGLDGTSDIKGLPKPFCYGVFKGVPGRCVNTARQIWQVSNKRFWDSMNTGAPWTIAARVAGVLLGTGVARTLAQFQAGKTDYAVNAIDLGTDQITLGVAFASATGTPVHVTSTGVVPAGLMDNQYYYARALGGAVISLHPTAADANANTNKVDITSAGTGAVTVSVNSTPYGCFDWCNSADVFTPGMFVRLGNKPSGDLTFEGKNHADGITSTPSGVALYDLLRWSLMEQGVATLAAAGTNLAGDTDSGFYEDSAITVWEFLAKVAGGVAAGTPSTPGGEIKLLQPVDPAAGVPVKEFTRMHIKPGSLQLVRSSDEWEGSVVWAINFHYKRNPTVLTRAAVAGASDAEIAFATQEWRVVPVSDAAVRGAHPNAREIDVYSSLDTEAAATAQANALLARLKVRRYLYTCEVPLKEAEALDINSCVLLTHPRFGMGAGLKFSVLGMQPNYSTQWTELLLWR